MYATVSNLIDRARAYVDDQNAADKAWIPDTTWEYWLTIEYHTVMQRLVSEGLLGPRFVEETITATGAQSYTLVTRVQAIASIREVNGSGAYVRMLRPLQPQAGRFATEDDNSAGQSGACGWAASQSDVASPTLGNVVVELRPSPTSGTYIVRVLAEPLNLVRVVTVGQPQAAAINLTAPAMDLIILGAANRALLKAGSASSSLNRLIERTEMDLAHNSAGRLLNVSPAVRNTDWQRLDLDPRNWWWV